MITEQTKKDYKPARPLRSEHKQKYTMKKQEIKGILKITDYCGNKTYIIVEVTGETTVSNIVVRANYLAYYDAKNANETGKQVTVVYHAARTSGTLYADYIYN